MSRIKSTKIITLSTKIMIFIKQNTVYISIFLFFISAANAERLPTNKVCFKKNCFIVELAATPEKRTRGLMFRKHLDLNKGMLFIFERENIYSFWMKNTLIPLDIIWINKDKEIVFINKHTQPCKKDPCPNTNPHKKALYILELNGGIADKTGLSIGDKAKFIKLDADYSIK